MKQFKRSFRGAVWALALGTLTACGGGEQQDADAQYLTLDLNGTPMTFNANVSANDPPAGSTVNFVTVGGSQTADRTGPSFSFQLVSPGVGLGTYDSARDELHGTYYVQGERGTTIYMSNDDDGTRFVMTVTRLDARGVAGTFSGALKERGTGDDAPLLHVSNGRFSARYNDR